MRPNNDIRVILVERDQDLYSSELGIFGKLYINGTYFCDTLENRNFAVPCGLYEIDYNDSPKFGRKLPMFFDKGKYDPSMGLRFHAGNSPDDSRGCILVGERYWLPSGVVAKKLRYSRNWTERLCNIFDHDDRRVTKTILVVASI